MSYGLENIGYATQVVQYYGSLGLTGIEIGFRFAAEHASVVYHWAEENQALAAGLAVVGFVGADTVGKIHSRIKQVDAVKGITDKIDVEGLGLEQQNLLNMVDNLRDKSRDVALLGPDENDNLYSAVKLSFGWAVVLAGNDGNMYPIVSETLDGLKQRLGLAIDNEAEVRRIDVLGKIGEEMIPRGVDHLEDLIEKYRWDRHVLFGNLLEHTEKSGDLVSRTPRFGSYAVKREDGTYAVDFYVDLKGDRELIDVPHHAEKITAEPIVVASEEEARQLTHRYNQMWHHSIIQFANLAKMKLDNAVRIKALEDEYPTKETDADHPLVAKAKEERTRLETLEQEFNNKGSSLIQLLAGDVAEGVKEGVVESFKTKSIVTFLATAAISLGVVEKIYEVGSSVVTRVQDRVVTAAGGPLTIDEYSLPPDSILSQIAEQKIEMGAVTLTANDNGQNISKLIKSGVLKPMDLTRIYKHSNVLDFTGPKIAEGFRMSEYFRNWASKLNTDRTEAASQFFITRRNCGLEMVAYNAPHDGDAAAAVNGSFIYMPGAPFADGVVNKGNNWLNFTAKQRQLIGSNFDRLAAHDYPDYIKQHTDAGKVLYRHPSNGRTYIFNYAEVKDFLTNPREQLGKEVPVKADTPYLQAPQPQPIKAIRQGRHIRDVESGYQRQPTRAELKKYPIPKDGKVADGSFVAVLAWDKNKKQYVSVYIERDRVGQDDTSVPKYGLLGGLLKWLPELRDTRLVALREIQEEWKREGGTSVLDGISVDRIEKVQTQYVYNKVGVAGHDPAYDQDRFPTLATSHVLVLNARESELALKQIELDDPAQAESRRARRSADRTGGETVNVFAATLDDLKAKMAAGKLAFHYKHEYEFLEKVVLNRLQQLNEQGPPRHGTRHGVRRTVAQRLRLAA